MKKSNSTHLKAWQLLVVVLTVAYANPIQAEETDFDIQTDAEIQILGNINGAYQALRETLLNNALIDKQDRWSGGNKHLVSLGDFLGSAEQAREANLLILNLWMTLQQQAKKAGGGLHVVLGDHEIMALTEQFSPIESAQNFVDTQQGQWLAQQPFVLRINKQLFAHAGLANDLNFESLVSLNNVLSEGLHEYSKHWQYFVDNDLRNSKVPFSKRFDYVKTLSESEARAKFLALRKNILFNNQSPVFYLGNVQCHPFFESDFLDKKLAQSQAERLWVTHAADKQNKPQSRFEGRLIILASNLQEKDTFSFENDLIDNPQIESKRDVSQMELWRAQIAPDGQMKIFLEPIGKIVPIEAAPVRRWHRPYELDDKAITEYLLTATITSQEETLEGRTKPIKITLEKDGKRLNGIFKFINHSSRRFRSKFFGAGDSYQHEMAAYHIDRMLGIELVPITVEREVEGRAGTVQLWMDNMASALQINEGDVDYTGHCDVVAQENLMNVFDYLIMNFDRNQTNIVFTKDDWQIWFIDHTRAFGTPVKQPPYQQGVVLQVTDHFRSALESLTRKKLDELKPWLRTEQIDTLWTRRNRLLNGNY